MIEISHQQARRLIRMALDSHPEDRLSRRGSRISDEQWGILQAHLESCPACRAHQARLNEMESSLRRILRSRWSGLAPGSLDGLPADWANRRAVRRLWAGRAARFGVWAAAALALLLLIRGPALLSGERLFGGRASTPAAALPSPAPTPTPGVMFRGVAVFETQVRGSREIFLLNSLGGPRGPQTANLTNHPAHDYAPAFSPDGEWIAFLSTRQEEDEQAEVLPKAKRLQAGTSTESAPQQAEGKPELYVMHLAGSRLTKLTDEPNIEWLGPLSWSPDGQWIALRGRRLDSDRQVYAYIVSLNPDKTRQARPIAAPDSLGLAGPPRFSPRGVKLAYQTAGQNPNVTVWNVAAGSLNTFPETPGAVQNPEDTYFQWFADGRSLSYGQAQAGGSPYYEIARADETSWDVLYSSAGDGPGITSGPTSVSPSPAWGRIAFLLDPDADGCRTLHIMSDKKPAPRPREIAGLCIDGPVEPDSWTSDGRWLALPAHEPGDEARPGIYAISTLLSPPGYPFERLGNLPAWSEQEQALRVSVRPESAPLDIQPIAAAAAGSAPPVTALSDEIPGTILASGQQLPAAGSQPLPEIVTLTPSTGEMVSRSLPLPPGVNPANVYCPVLSPGGEHAAVVVYDPASPLLHILVVNREGQLITEIKEDPEAGVPSANCPVWSPDGKSIAMVLTRITGPSLARIAVFGLDGSAASLVPKNAIRLISGLVWTPDNQNLLLYFTGLPSEKIMAWNIHEPPPDPEHPESALIELLPGASSSMMLLEAAVSPDGSQIAVLLFERISPPRAWLQVYGAEDMLEQSRLELTNVLPNTRPAAFVTWTPDGQLGFARAADPASGHIAEVVFFDPAAQTERTAALIHDPVYAAAWSPDRRWLAYTNESGLWLLDLRSPHSPAHIRGGEITAVDWR